MRKTMVAGILLIGAVLLTAASDEENVKVRVIDPVLKISTARIVRWTGELKMKIQTELGDGRGPMVGWVQTPTNAANDVLVVFCSTERRLNMQHGFDVVGVDGRRRDDGIGSNSICPGKGNRYAAANFLASNVHGVFLLRFHGETNVVAEFTIP